MITWYAVRTVYPMERILWEGKENHSGPPPGITVSVDGMIKGPHPGDCTVVLRMVDETGAYQDTEIDFKAVDNPSERLGEIVVSDWAGADLNRRPIG